MKILVINAGSSSLKFQIYDMVRLRPIVTGIIEQIGKSTSPITMHAEPQNSGQTVTENRSIPEHKTATLTMLALLQEYQYLNDINELAAIGHRVVHGGDAFSKPVLIDDHVCTIIAELASLAPLHNPPTLAGIEVTMAKAPKVPQVAIFDTAFHQTIPDYNYIYGLPYELYEQEQVRRYGFHGTSYAYVIKQAALHLDKPLADTKLIAVHLGNGTSIAAIAGGKSLDTSMGMTPVEGLLMGTRCGDIDAGILFYLARKTGHPIEQLDNIVNENSGLKGICGENDMRTIIDRVQKGDTRAELALNVFCQRIKKYIGAYIATLNGADAIIFTGGIGENASLVRELSCKNMEQLGIEIDHHKNNQRLHDQNPQEIHTAASTIQILVIPTNEELEIASQTMELIQP